VATEPAAKSEKQNGLVLGLVFLPLVVILLGLDFVPQWWARQVYVEGRCVVLDERIVEDPPGGRASNSTYRPEFLIRYTVAGQDYQTWAYNAVDSSSAWRWPKEQVLERFTVGQEYPCWYDASDPSRVMVVRGYSCLSYVLLPAFATSVFLIGRGIVRHRRNARRAAGEQRGAESGAAGSSAAADRDGDR